MELGEESEGGGHSAGSDLRYSLLSLLICPVFPRSCLKNEANNQVEKRTRAEMSLRQTEIEQMYFHVLNASFFAQR